MAKSKHVRSQYSGSAADLKSVRVQSVKQAYVHSNLHKSFAISVDSRNGKIVIGKKLPKKSTSHY